MLLLAADENFNNDIVRGLLRRKPDLDIVRIQDEGLSGADDQAVLEWAAQNGRILLTHDVSTITHYAYDRVRSGRPMPGIFEVSLDIPINIVIDDILLLAKYSVDGEWEGQVRYLPLR
ncbi:MAG: DUF5615 family PIN-like protein [Thermodesulfobacteriota bacterium]|nr:DUF5615 family PIN-like protein [Thermodesulfobacteriota bacterium]